MQRDVILQGDCVAVMNSLPAASVDLVFADPPYNLQLRKTLRRPDQTLVDGVDHDWDKFSDGAAYDAFTASWLAAAKRVLKPAGALWVIGSYHNIYRIGHTLAEHGWWLLNDVVWAKPNAMPNFKGTRLQNSTEILLWATPHGATAKYTFNYAALKEFNDGKQLNNIWEVPICLGAERVKDSTGQTLHPTQKPEALLYRVLLASTKAGDVVLDPFFGTGTTGVVAKKLGRHFIGIEQAPDYIAAAEARINAARALPASALQFAPTKRDQPRVAFGALVAAGLLPAGSVVTNPKNTVRAIVQLDGSLVCDAGRGSIHQLGAKLQNKAACNGWDYWQFNGAPIDKIREAYIVSMKSEAL